MIGDIIVSDVSMVYFMLIDEFASLGSSVLRKATSKKVTASHLGQSIHHRVIFVIKTGKTCYIGYQSKALDILH